jgi:hypothetical protein
VLAFGKQKFNLHQVGKEFEPRPTGRLQAQPTSASSPPCPSRRRSSHLRRCGVEILEGPVTRTGATGAIL